MNNEITSAIIGALIGGFFTLLTVPCQHWLQRRAEQSRQRDQQKSELAAYQKQYKVEDLIPTGLPRTDSPSASQPIKTKSGFWTSAFLFVFVIAGIVGFILLLEWLLPIGIFRWVALYFFLGFLWNLRKQKDVITKYASVVAAIFVAWRYFSQMLIIWELIKAQF